MKDLPIPRRRVAVKLIVECAAYLPDALLAGACMGLFIERMPQVLPSVKLARVSVGGVDYPEGE